MSQNGSRIFDGPGGCHTDEVEGQSAQRNSRPFQRENSWSCAGTAYVVVVLHHFACLPTDSSCSPELPRKAHENHVNFQHPTPPAKPWNKPLHPFDTPTSPGFPTPFSVSEGRSWPAVLSLAATCLFVERKRLVDLDDKWHNTRRRVNRLLP